MITTAKAAAVAGVLVDGLRWLLAHDPRQNDGAAAPRSITCAAGECDAHIARTRFQHGCESTWIAVSDTSWPADAVAESVDDSIVANAYGNMTADERFDFMVDVIASGDQLAQPMIVRYGEQAAEALAADRCRAVESPRPRVGRSSPTLRTTRPLTRCPRTTPLAPNAPPVVLPALQAAGVAHRVETCPMT